MPMYQFSFSKVRNTQGTDVVDCTPQFSISKRRCLENNQKKKLRILGTE